MFDPRIVPQEYLLAGDSKASRVQLQTLSESRDVVVRSRVAENPATPLTTLVHLLRDESADVRISLSNNPEVSVLFLLELAADADPDVRFALAENSALPDLILLFLSADENPYVASRAQKTLSNRAIVRHAFAA